MAPCIAPDTAIRQNNKRDRPSPLRIVKRHRSSYYGESSSSIQHARRDENDSELSSITDGTKRLQVCKRRSGQPGPTVPNFWASSVDLRQPQTRPWEDAVARCRRLLRKSTPNITNYRRHFSKSRSQSSRTESLGGTSSSCSSQQHTNTDCYRLSSTSSYAADANQDYDAQQNYGSKGDFQTLSSRNSSYQVSPRQISQNTKTYLLSPCIVVTPQKQELHGSERSIWLAVEISGKLSQISQTQTPASNEKTRGIAAGAYIDHKLDRFFDFGCLYNLTVEVSGAPETAILDVIHGQSWPTTVYAGASLLLVVHVQLNATAHRRDVRHTRSRSDELMEELEHQLGDVRDQLMKIKVLYLHSVFPEVTNADSPHQGLCHLQSRMETQATATINRKTGSSVWSPRCETSKNSLFSLMVQHWGDEKAMIIQRRISDSQTPSAHLIGARECVSLGGTSNNQAGIAINSKNSSETVHFDSQNCQAGWDYKLDSADARSLEKTRGEKKREEYQSQELSKPDVKTPIREIYSFGERALKALGPQPMFERGFARQGTMASSPEAASLKHKDSRFWEWGTWF